MSVEGNPNLFELYKNFEQNEGKVLRRGTPFAVLAVGNIVAGVAAWTGNDSVRDAYSHLQVWLPDVLVTVASIIPIMSTVADNERIAVEIARVEGRNPQIASKEEHRVHKVLTLSQRISPSKINLMGIDINNKFGNLLDKTHRYPLDERINQERRFQRSDIKRLERAFERFSKDPQARTQMARDALILAEQRWRAIADDEEQSSARRRYALFMSNELKRKILEYLQH
jgi:hypothetical protein